jgi:homoserine kinase type II
LLQNTFVAVYTEVSLPEAAALLARLGLGHLSALQPCSGGIENTNYFADTDTGHYVLTLFERLSASELPFYLRLMQHLARRGIAVPEPHADAQGELLHRVCGKPAAVVSRLPGHHHMAPDAQHCASVGAMLARMHLAGLDFPLHQPHLRGLAWWNDTAKAVRAQLSAAQCELLDAELAYQGQLAQSSAYAALPRGPIHADLFRDNVVFVGDELTGFFDFYFAGVDAFLFDIAVCLNDWCSDAESGRLNEALAQSFASGYDAVRPLSGTESRLLAAMLRGAALRFWLSRLWDLHSPRDAHLLKAKDPAPLERILRSRIDSPWHYFRN